MILTLKSVILTSFVKKSTNGVVVLPSFSPLPHFRTKSWSQLHSLMIFMIFNKNRVESDWKTHEDIDTSHIKIINFSIGITKIQNFFRLAAVPLSGVALTTSILRQPDVWGHQNFSKFRKFYFLFLHDLVTHLKKKYVILKEFFHTSNPKIYFFSYLWRELFIPPNLKFIPRTRYFHRSGPVLVPVMDFLDVWSFFTLHYFPRDRKNFTQR